MPGSTPASAASVPFRDNQDPSVDGVSSDRHLQAQPSPLQDDMAHDHQYASLLEAVSNIHMSARPSDVEYMSSVEDDLPASPTGIRSDHQGDIYDLQHVLVHHQQEYEQNMHQARQDYHMNNSQRTTSTHAPSSSHRLLDNEASSNLHGQPSAVGVYDTHSLEQPRSPALAAVGEQPPSPPSPQSTLLFGTFDNRPTISSSYFPSSMESTIVLSSPPPGRLYSRSAGHNSGTHLSQSPNQPHLISRATSFSPLSQYQNPTTFSAVSSSPSPVSSTSGRSYSQAISSQFGNGPYRPYFTGRDLIEVPAQQNAGNTTSLSARQSMNMSTASTSTIQIHGSSQQEELSEETDSDGGRILSGNHGTGRWFAYGSLIPLDVSTPYFAEWSEAIHFQRQRLRHFQRLHLHSQQQQQEGWLQPTTERDIDGNVDDMVQGVPELNRYEEDNEDEKSGADMDLDDPSDAQLERQHRRRNSASLETDILGHLPPPMISLRESLSTSLPTLYSPFTRPPREPAWGRNSAQRGLESRYTPHASHLPIASRYLHRPAASFDTGRSVTDPSETVLSSSETTRTHTRHGTAQQSASGASITSLVEGEEESHGVGSRRYSYSITADLTTSGYHRYRNTGRSNHYGDTETPVPTVSSVPVAPATPSTTTTTTSVGSQTNSNHYLYPSSQSPSLPSSMGSQQGYRYYPPANRVHYSRGEEYQSSQQRQIGLKEVVRMACRFCEVLLCERGMKAQLLADQTIGLFSTDDEPVTVELIGDPYRPTNCSCEISDTACLVCPRFDPVLARPLRWQDLPPPDQDDASRSLGRGIQRADRKGRLIMGGMVRRNYDSICR
ncbi:Protein fam72a [Actinomortierella wolfii]|nr:Protein fam72a [Actinomortierella wolfii]